LFRVSSLPAAAVEEDDRGARRSGGSFRYLVKEEVEVTVAEGFVDVGGGGNFNGSIAGTGDG
jgi:hypothetical protein